MFWLICNTISSSFTGVLSKTDIPEFKILYLKMCKTTEQIIKIKNSHFSFIISVLCY